MRELIYTALAAISLAVIVTVLNGCAIHKEVLTVSCQDQKAQLAKPPIIINADSVIYYDAKGTLRKNDKETCGIK